MSVLLGAAMGILYDCFRVLRIVFPPAAKKGAVLAEDIIFWLIYGFCIFCFASVTARGQVRFFMFVGSLTGFVLYLVTVGNLIVGVIRQISGTFYKILHKVYSFAIEPFVKIIKIMCQKIMPFFVRNPKNEKISERSSKKPLKNTCAMVYNKYVKLVRSILKKDMGR